MVADMEVDKVMDKVADMVADMEVDKVVDMVFNMVADMEVYWSSAWVTRLECPKGAKDEKTKSPKGPKSPALCLLITLITCLKGDNCLSMVSACSMEMFSI